MTESLALFDADLLPATQAIAEPVPARPASRVSALARSKPTVLAVDGNSLVHRAFHAYRGTTGGARYGFFALLSVVCDQVAYDGLLVGFDCRARSHRRARYRAYKAQRPDKHEQLDAALDELPDIASDMGVHVVVAEGWEADDVLASAAATAEATGWQCVVASPDRDVLGLVSADTTVLQIRGGGRSIQRIAAADFRRRYRVSPSQYVQLAALRGDSSDNLPGIAGIGAKKAADLLRLYHSVGDAVADPLGCRSVLGPELGQALIDDVASGDRSVFRRNIALMTLHREVAIDLDQCRLRATPDEIIAVLRRWRMTGLHARMCAALCPRPDPEEVPTVSDEDVPPMAP